MGCVGSWVEGPVGGTCVMRRVVSLMLLLQVVVVVLLVLLQVVCDALSAVSVCASASMHTVAPVTRCIHSARHRGTGGGINELHTPNSCR